MGDPSPIAGKRGEEEEKKEKEEEREEKKEDVEGEEVEPFVRSSSGSNGKKNSPPATTAKVNGKTSKGNSASAVKHEDDGLRQRRRNKSSSDSEVSMESLEEYIPTPPDGGWGWVIVLASSVGNLIVDGIGYGFGVFLMPLVRAFDAPKSQVSMVGSLLCGTYLFAGPIVSAMTNKFGCRAVVIAGSIIATAAFIIASQSTSIVMLIITYGVMGGIGLGMMYLPCIVSVGYYFEKRRAFATGLAVCGSGVGTFIFPPLSDLLLSQFNWQGGILIIAGIIFNGCVCGALMRPLEARPKPKPKANGKAPREKNLLDRLKESTHKNRSVSECSPEKGVSNNHSIQEGVLEAKLQREKCLQETDSELGSLPSVAFVTRLDSMSDHRRLSNEPRRQKLSMSSAADSATSPTREVTPRPEVTPGSSQPETPTITIESEDSDFTFAGDRKDGTISPDPDSETKVSETASSKRSEYMTPPVSPSSTNPSSPTKEVARPQLGNGSVKKSETFQVGTTKERKSEGDSTMNGVIRSSPAISTTANASPTSHTTQTSKASEFAPLLEVPDASVAIGHKKGEAKKHNAGSGHYGGSRTNMTHLSSMRSLHVSKKDLARPLYRKDIFYSGSVLNIPQYQSQPDMKSYITSITTIPGESEFVDGPSSSSRCVNTCCAFLPRPARDVLGEMVDISLLKDISFMLICLGNILTFLGFFIPFMFLVDRAVELGISQNDAAFLISIIGITNTVGRVAIGKLADLRILDSLVITYISIYLCGLVTALIPFCKTFALLAVDAALFGLGVAAFVSLSSIIICDRLGLDKLTNGFGLLSMVRGVGSMVGPPLAGAMYDSSGSYDLSFFLGGLLMFAGASCHVLLHLPCLRTKDAENDLVLEAVEEVTDPEDQFAGVMGSRPQIVTLEDAMTSV